MERAVGLLARVGDRAGAQRLLARFDVFPQVPATSAARSRALGELALAAGEVQAALTAFEQSFVNARRRDSRLPRARALLQDGDHARAEQVLRDTADHPAAIYSGPEPQTPGAWREAVTALASLVERRDAAAAADLRRRFAPMFVDRAASTTW